MSWAYVIIGLLLLILVHELGHFVVARLVGAKATRFLVGFPPVVLSFTRGETEYGLGAIPLGGYVRIVGMNRPQADDVVVCQD
ncbi:MAG: site-2 protease family protein, partial [Thermoleophilia bacterium]|nr:site-2 protease family protein [Thermoleophilia bacterium]